MYTMQTSVAAADRRRETNLTAVITARRTAQAWSLSVSDQYVTGHLSALWGLFKEVGLNCHHYSKFNSASEHALGTGSLWHANVCHDHMTFDRMMMCTLREA